MILSDADKAKIIEIAHAWEQTKYMPGARNRGLGVDCAQLPCAVYEEAGFVGHVELGNYSPDINQHVEGYTGYIDKILEYAYEIDESEVQSADMVVFLVAKAFFHSAIIVKWPDVIIHAVKGHGVIQSSANEGFLKKRKKRFFRLK